MRRTGIAALILAAALTASCGKPVLREADPSLGDYYTKEEYKKLSSEQREQYCQDLADQLETYQDQIAQGEEALASLSKGTPRLAAELDSLRALEAQLTERLAAERAKPAHAPAPASTAKPSGGAATSYVVKPGDSLWKISASPSVYGSADSWQRLYEANRGTIHDPNVIHPGQEISIPR
jgi:nucleoid-associated protein YgaU